MGSNSVQAVMIREAGVSLERIQEFQAFAGTAHHRHCDRVIQRDHGVAGHTPEQIVERQDLRPIRVFRLGSFVVNGGDGSLQLVGADGSLR